MLRSISATVMLRWSMRSIFMAASQGRRQDADCHVTRGSASATVSPDRNAPFGQLRLDEAQAEAGLGRYIEQAARRLRRVFEYRMGACRGVVPFAGLCRVQL